MQYINCAYKNNSQQQVVRFFLDFINDNYYHLITLCFESNDCEQNPYACRSVIQKP